MSINNFKLHEQAEKMAAGNSAYELARRIIELEERLKAAMADNNKIRGRMHDQWIRQNKMKAEAVRGGCTRKPYSNRGYVVLCGRRLNCALKQIRKR